MLRIGTNRDKQFLNPYLVPKVEIVEYPTSEGNTCVSHTREITYLSLFICSDATGKCRT